MPWPDGSTTVHAPKLHPVQQIAVEKGAKGNIELRLVGKEWPTKHPGIFVVTVTMLNIENFIYDQGIIYKQQSGTDVMN